MATQHKLYGGEVVLEFDEGLHSYTANGVPCPSVTGILRVIDKPALPRWAAKETAAYVEAELLYRATDPVVIAAGWKPDEIYIKNLCKEAKAAPWRKSQDAADIGSIVHRFAELYALGEKPPLPINPQARAAAEQFLGWWEGNHVEVIAAERKVYNRAWNYAGTVDLIAEVRGAGLVIADFKTSSGIWPEYRLQLAAYQGAYEEEHPGMEIDQRLCLRFGKDGAFESAAYETGFLPDWHGFMAALNLHRWQESISPKKRRAA